MKKEHTLLMIAGLFILAYVLDAVVTPLSINLASPYEYLRPAIMAQYPFTTASIVIKAIGIFLTPLLLMSFAEGHNTAKGAVLLVLIALMQLYALQDIVTKAAVVPLEWSLSLSLAGITLFIPMFVFFIRGGLDSLHKQLGGKGIDEEDSPDEQEQEE